MQTSSNLETQPLVAEAEQQTEDRGAARKMWVGLGAGAIGQCTLAVAIALIDPGAPGSFFKGRGTFLLILFALLVVATVATRIVEWRRGKAPLAGPWWEIARAKTLFQLALMGALPALGLVTALAWAAGGAWADVLWRAWIVLIVGGAMVGLAGSLVAHLLFLMLPRRH